MNVEELLQQKNARFEKEVSGSLFRRSTDAGFDGVRDDARFDSSSEECGYLKAEVLVGGFQHAFSSDPAGFADLGGNFHQGIAGARRPFVGDH